MVVRDLNCDNYPDVIIAGNDHTHDVATGIMDAGKGIVLINKEAGSSFEPLLPAASGLLLRGMVESLILLEGDDPILLAGINRGKMAAYRIKKR